jgi:hypothetical protein
MLLSIQGHYNLFLGGVLHRDVSNGNILRLREPIERTGGLSADVWVLDVVHVHFALC